MVHHHWLPHYKKIHRNAILEYHISIPFGRNTTNTFNLRFPNFLFGTTQNIEHHQTIKTTPPSGIIWPHHCLLGPGWPRQTVSAGNTPSGSSLDGAHHRLRPHRGPEANFDPRFVTDAGLRLPQVSLVHLGAECRDQNGTRWDKYTEKPKAGSSTVLSWSRSACSKLSGTASTHCQGQLDEAMNTIHLQFWAMPTKLLSRRLPLCQSRC